MNLERAKALLVRADVFADNMLNEGNYLKKEIKEIQKELKTKK